MISDLNIDYLDDEQVAYECQLCNLPIDPVTQETIKELKEKIRKHHLVIQLN